MGDVFIKSGRGTGRTSAQMKEAKPGSVFVVGNVPFVRYATALAQKLGRTDLRIVPLEQLTMLRGQDKLGPGMLVIDHACTPTDREQEMLGRL